MSIVGAVIGALLGIAAGISVGLLLLGVILHTINSSGGNPNTYFQSKKEEAMLVGTFAAMGAIIGGAVGLLAW